MLINNGEEIGIGEALEMLRLTEQQQFQQDGPEQPKPPQVSVRADVWDKKVKKLGHFSVTTGADEGFGMGC